MKKIDKNVVLAISLIAHSHMPEIPHILICNKPKNHFRGGITKRGKTKFPRNK